MGSTIEVDAFVEMGVVCAEQGRLTEGLELLAARLDLAGVGQLLAEAMRYDWTPAARPAKGDPNPTPKDPPKPPPPPPPKGWRP